MLEGHADSKMEGEIATENGIKQGPMLTLVGVSGIDGLHTHVEAKDEIVEIEAQAQTVGHRNLLIKFIKLKLSTRLFLVVTQGPDISSVDKHGTIKLPEQEGAILHVQVKLNIARLVDEVDAAVGTTELTRTKLAHPPSANGVGSS